MHALQYNLFYREDMEKPANKFNIELEAHIFVDAALTLLNNKFFKSGSNTIGYGGTKGKRFALPNSEIMIHQPSGGAKGQATEIQIAAENILKTKKRLNEILAANTGKPYETIAADTERDNYMSAQEAADYGLIDGVITNR